MPKPVSLCVLESTVWPKMRGKFLPVTVEDGLPKMIRSLEVTLVEVKMKNILRCYTKGGWTEFGKTEVDKKGGNNVK